MKMGDGVAESEMMTQSLLDKPMCQLTEEDIAQLTREDCRRYLREKGMRRPSWNKSQAIEQVISLKTLLEPLNESVSSNSNVVSRQQQQRIQVHPTEDLTQMGLSQKRNFGDMQILVAGNGNESGVGSGYGYGFGQRMNLPPAVGGDMPAVMENVQDRNPNLTKGPVRQMTIFYCGQVYVYDYVPADKAFAIMKIAANNTPERQESPAIRNPPISPFACQFQVSAIRSTLAFSPGVSPSMHMMTEFSQQYREDLAHSREVDPDGPQSRKASVQRYLEKRKDRGRFKIKRKAESSSNLDMYLNPQQLRDQNPNEQSSQSRGCSPPQPIPPVTPSRCSSVDTEPSKDAAAAVSIDLN